MKQEEYEVPDKEAGEDIEPINQFTYFFVKGIVQDLQGKMLTVVEATISDPTQRKAAKDIVKEHFNTKLNWLFEVAHFVEVDTSFPHEIIPISKPLPDPFVKRKKGEFQAGIGRLKKIVQEVKELEGNVKTGL